MHGLIRRKSPGPISGSEGLVLAPKRAYRVVADLHGQMHLALIQRNNSLRL